MTKQEYIDREVAVYVKQIEAVNKKMDMVNQLSDEQFDMLTKNELDDLCFDDIKYLIKLSLKGVPFDVIDNILKLPFEDMNAKTVKNLTNGYID